MKKISLSFSLGRFFKRVPVGALAIVSVLAITGCESTSSTTPPGKYSLPDQKYVYKGSVPVETKFISDDEFARLYTEGKIKLESPVAREEMEALEAKQDAEDLATIQEYQAKNPNSPDMLRKLTPVTDGSATTAGEGNFHLKVPKSGPFSLLGKLTKGKIESHITMGERFRLRSVSGAIRATQKQNASKEHQLNVYKETLAVLPAEAIKRLVLPSYEKVKAWEVAEILELNNKVALNWADLSKYFPVLFTPILSPPCSSDAGNGTNGDQAGNTAACGVFDAAGVMANYNWKGKEHISCVKNQGARGTCPAFSSVSTMEWQVHKKFGDRTNLSEQALYARMKHTWGGGQHYGDGYWPNPGFNSNFAEGYLTPFENQWNYNPAFSRTQTMGAGADGISGTNDDPIIAYSNSCTGYTETCSNVTHMTQFVCVNAGPFGTFCGYFYPDVNPANFGYRVASGTTNYWDPAKRDLSVAYLILAVGLFRSPAIWSFDIETSSWGVNANGYVTHSSSTENTNSGAHAVHVVGVITNSKLAEILPSAPAGSGGGYFIVKNSWNNCWGDAGFAYIPFDSIRNYSLELISAPTVL